jgi:hypothetical protein
MYADRRSGEPIRLDSASLSRKQEIVMIGKVIGALVGAKAAEHTRGVGGTGGAVLGAAAVALARRFGPMGMIAAAAGGYAMKRYNEKRERELQAARRAGGPGGVPQY